MDSLMKDGASAGAKRAGAARRPIPVNPSEATDEADAEETADEENEESEVPHPDAAPAV